MLTLPQASSVAAGVDGLALLLLAVCSLFALGIAGAMLVLLVRYRAGNEVDRTAPPLNSNLLECAWIALPTLLSLGLFGLGASQYYHLFRVPTGLPMLDIVGKQWMWQVHYPDGRQEINALHLQIGQKVAVRLVSEDVIHDFFVPAFRLKHDVLPGQYSYLWFEPTEVGQYRFFCSEFCGTSHAQMQGMVSVLSASDYRRWQQEHQLLVPPEVRGARLFESFGCAGCHREVKQPGPRLEGLYGRAVTLSDGTSVRADDAYLRESILTPERRLVAGFANLMPTYERRLNESQVLDLLAYLRSLK